MLIVRYLQNGNVYDIGFIGDIDIAKKCIDSLHLPAWIAKDDKVIYSNIYAKPIQNDIDAIYTDIPAL